MDENIIFSKQVIVITAITYLLSIAANAQKLPNKQEVSLHAPVNVKIDGNAAEWGALQAYNNNTDIFYTLANDDENLYLIVQAAKSRVIQKIMQVGISLTINAAVKRSPKTVESLLVSYPVLDIKTSERIFSATGVKATGNEPDINTHVSQTKKDSLALIANTLFTSNAKEMKVKGIDGLSDTLVSVYNERGIKVASAFDNKGVYSYELAIPLKLLGLSIENKTFSYNVKLISRLDLKKGFGISYRYINDEPVDINLDLDSTTDFWGEYTLSKK